MVTGLELRKEVAKFASGAETFHGFVHAVLAVSGTTVTAFGITPGRTWHFAAAVINGLIAALLGMYAWRTRGRP
jgi:hypothetical protein